MKSQKGITLVSLVVYVIVMMIVLGVIGTIITNFYQNTDTIQADTEDIVQFNKFNTYFLKQIKSKGNTVDSITDNYILFKSGNSFSFTNNKIYYNDIQICNGVQEFTILSGKNGDGIDKSIVFVNINFENFTKAMNYKIEEIY